MTFEKVKKLIAEQLSVAEDKVKPETNIVKDLGADSIDIVQMLMTLEDEFGVSIPDGEAEKMQTVEAVVKLIDSKKKG